MAKGDVTMRFDADTARFISAINGARLALEAAGVKSREFADSSTKDADAIAKAFTSMGKSMAGSLIGFTTAAGAVAAGVDLILSAVNNRIKQVEDRADKFLGRTRTLDDSLNDAGQGASIPVIRSKIKDLSKTQFENKSYTVESLNNMYARISSSLGEKATPEEKFDALKSATVAQDTGRLSDEAAMAYAVNYANIKRQSPNTGKTGSILDREVVNQAYSFTVNRPNDPLMNPNELQFLSRSKDKTMAMSMLQAAVQKDEKTRGLAAIESAGYDHIDTGEIRKIILKQKRQPREFTEEDRRILALSKFQQGPERMSAVMEDPALAPVASRLAVNNLIKGRRTGNMLLEWNDKDADSQALVNSDKVASDTAKLNEKYGSEDNKLQQIRKLRRQQQQFRMPGSENIPGVPFVSGFVPIENADKQDFGTATGNMLDFINNPVTSVLGAAYPDNDKALDALERAARHMEEINGKIRPRDKALESNKRGDQ